MAKQIAVIALIIAALITATLFVLLVYRIAVGIFRDKKMTWYDKLKWYVKEFIKCLSNEPSFFSTKRIYGVIAFTVLQWGMIHWMIVQLTSLECKLTAQDLAIWASIEGFMCGFSINKIQKEKIETNVNGNTEQPTT